MRRVILIATATLLAIVVVSQHLIVRVDNQLAQHAAEISALKEEVIELRLKYGLPAMARR